MNVNHMTIEQMFTSAIFAKTNHPGYMVYADRGNGMEYIGPYHSKEIAFDCASDLKNASVIDWETGEVLNA